MSPLLLNSIFLLEQGQESYQVNQKKAQEMGENPNE